MADFQNIGFDRTRASEVSAASTPEPKSIGLPEFEEEDFQDVPFFDSFGAAASDTGIVLGAARQAADAPSREEMTEDPNFDLQLDLESRPEDLAYVQKFLDQPNDPRVGSFLHELAGARSSGHAQDILARAREAEERMKLMEANPSAAFLGSVAGVGVDIAATIAALPSGGLPLVTGGRALAALRTARLGAIEGAGQQAVQSGDNPFIAPTDIVEAAGLGALFGGVLGFAAPSLVGNVRRVADDIVNPRALTDDVIDEAAASRGGSVGAAAAPENIPVPAKGSGSLVARHIAPKAFQRGFLRNLKRIIVDIGVEGDKAFTASGRRGGREWFGVMARAVRISTLMADEVAGKVARADSVQDVIDDFHAHRMSREQGSQRNYAGLTKQLYGAGALTNFRKNSPLPLIGRGLEGKISQEQFETMSDELAQLEGRNSLRGVEDAVPDRSVIPEEILNSHTPEQIDHLMTALKKQADEETEFYQRFGELELKHGLIKEEDLIPGYRPQRWDRDAIEADPTGFDTFLMEVFKKEPEADWIRQVYRTTEEVDEAGKVTTPSEPVIKDGETFFDLQRRDPELADEILSDWEAGLKAQAESKLAAATEILEKELKRVRGKSAQEVHARIGRNVQRLEGQIEKMEKRLGELEGPDRTVMAGRLGAKEVRLAEEMQKLDALNHAARNVDDLDAFLRKFGNNRQTTDLKTATGKFVRASAREAAAAARKSASDQIEAIRKSILSGDSPFGFIEGDFITGSSRFKRRQINLGSFRHTPEARRFLLTNSHDARASYETSAGVQIAMRETFGSDFDTNALREQALAGFEADLKRASDDKTRAAILKEKKEAERIFDQVFKELTHEDVTKLKGHARSVSDAAAITNTAMAAMSLGGVALAQLGDMAVQMMAGGRLSTGFNVFWRGNARKHIQEILEDEAETAVILQGVSVLDAARFRAIADIDGLGFDIPGGQMQKIMRTTSEIAKIEGWANLMNVWNTTIRGGFGLDFARQIDKDLLNYSKLSDQLKGYYAKLGIDEEIARDMSALMEKSHKKFVNGKLRVPDSAAWADARPDLLTRYRRAIQAAGDEAMIAPGVADRPFLRSFPGGRLIMQFQSFMFTAGERFIAPMIQELRLHPLGMRPYFAALMGWLLVLLLTD